MSIVILIGLISACSIESLPAVPAVGVPEPMQSIQVNGDGRQFLLHVPDGVVPAEGWPLVVGLHGLGSNAAEMRRLTGFDELAGDERFIVAYPEGLSRAWIDAGIGTTIANTDIAVRNLEFISTLIDELDGEYRLDPRRIYVAGLSNGGMFAFHLACHLSDRIAAVGLVASASLSQSFDDCAPARPVSYVAFHGTGDTVVPYGGGKIVPGFEQFGEFQSAHEAAGFWAEVNGCDAQPEAEELPGRTSGDFSFAVRESWPSCDSGGAVELVTLDGGHTWPGRSPTGTRLGATNLDVDATLMLWEFFAANPRPDTP